MVQQQLSRTVRWYMIKFVPDMVRREPVNVGVVAFDDESYAARFIGVDCDRKLAPGRLQLPPGLGKRAYRDWVDYYLRKADEGRWDEVFRSQSHRPRNFNAESGGSAFESAVDVQALADEMFSRVVGRGEVDNRHKSNGQPRLHVRKQVLEIFRRLSIKPIENAPLLGQYAEGGADSEVRFQYQHQNGRLHLMDALTSRQMIDVHLRDFNARSQAVLRHRYQDGEDPNLLNFIMFISTECIEGEGRDIEDVLRPVEGVGQAVDVDDLDFALERVDDMLTHSAG